jgi:soluble lytic murein transglycosylase-like protein
VKRKGLALLLGLCCFGDVRILKDASGHWVVSNTRGGQGGSRVRTSAAPAGAAAAPVDRTGDHWDHIQDAALRYGLDPDLVAAVIRTESGFRAHAVSPKGAMGLMQLMPSTARLLGVEDVFDGRENIFGGCRYLRSLIDQFDGDLKLALAAYNAGPEAVSRHNGIPPYRETQNYVRQVLALYNGESVTFNGPRRVRILRDGSGRMLVTNQRR